MKRRTNERGKMGMAKDKRRSEFVQFECEFTEKIRRIFKAKRLTLGLSYSSLGEIIGANWSTIRKWETGHTTNCNLRYRIAIEDFLNDDAHHILLRSQGANYSLYSTGNAHAPDIAIALERLENTYRLCNGHPDFCDYIWNSLNALSLLMLKKLVAAGTGRVVSDKEMVSGKEIVSEKKSE